MIHVFQGPAMKATASYLQHTLDHVICKQLIVEHQY